MHDRLTAAPGVADGSVYPGRIQTNRFPYSRVTYIDDAMGPQVSPAGWQITPDDCSQAPDIQFWEFHSTDLAGNPVDTSGRLPCSPSSLPPRRPSGATPPSC